MNKKNLWRHRRLIWTGVGPNLICHFRRKIFWYAHCSHRGSSQAFVRSSRADEPSQAWSCPLREVSDLLVVGEGFFKSQSLFSEFFFYLIWFNKSALGIGSKFRSLMYFVSLHSSASKSPNSVWTRQLAIWAIIDSAHVRFACRISRLIERQNKWRVNSSWSCSHGSDG